MTKKSNVFTDTGLYFRPKAKADSAGLIATELMISKEEKKAVDLFKKINGSLPEKIARLPGGGSGKSYFRLTSKKSTCLAACHPNAEENARFGRYSEAFARAGLNVPAVLGVSAEGDAYLVEDLGDLSLERHLAGCGGDENKLYEAYLPCLGILSTMHAAGGERLRADLEGRAMNRDWFKADFEYFTENFARKFDLLPTLSQAALAEMDDLLDALAGETGSGFVSRDFQSRNFMLSGGKHFLIDFQGGALGSRLYDLASLLYSSSSFLTEPVRIGLLERCLEDAPGEKGGLEAFSARFYRFVFIRRIRSLGTYGHLGFALGKPSFANALRPSLASLNELGRRGRPAGMKNFYRFLSQAEETLTRRLPGMIHHPPQPKPTIRTR